MPHLIRRLENANIVGKDIHKSLKPIVAEMGGLGILFGFYYWYVCWCIFIFSTYFSIDYSIVGYSSCRYYWYG